MVVGVMFRLIKCIDSVQTYISNCTYIDAQKKKCLSVLRDYFFR